MRATSWRAYHSFVARSHSTSTGPVPPAYCSLELNAVRSQTCAKPANLLYLDAPKVAWPEQCHYPAGSRRPLPFPSPAPSGNFHADLVDGAVRVVMKKTMLWMVLCFGLALNGLCSSCPVAEALQTDNASFVSPDGALRHWSKREASFDSPTSDQLHRHYQQPHQQVVVDDDYDERTLVQTRNGLVRGIRKQALNETVDVYLGIPFAKAPVGELRFRKPVPIDPWQGVLDARRLPNSCQQERYDVFPGFRGEEMWNPNTPISEDCLYLNVWVPASRRRTGGATVLVWIYGGGYMSGTSTLEVYDAILLAAANDIIVASINYRVGAFGFLYLDSDEAPGNMGLYDQALAIKWIKDNIQAFGGDPDSITLFGESAGAGSVSVHLMSPVSGHLARRAILQSGSVNAPWSYMSAETSRRIGAVLVADVGCNASLIGIDTSAVMECMRSVPAKNLSLIQWNSYWGILGFPSAPTIDGVFLPKHPNELLKEGSFPPAEILVGTNQDEGTYFILYDFIQYFKKDDPSILEREKFLEIINTIFKNWSQLEREAIIFQYTDWDYIENGYLNQKMIGDVVGDYYFTCPTNYFAQKFAEHGMKVYYYHFTQRSSTSPWGQWMGVIHADEVEYVFGHPLNASRNYTEGERDLSRRVMSYFATFAKTGKPVNDSALWPQYSRNEPRYFILNSEVRGVGHGPRATACAFWNEFMPKLSNRQSGNQCERESSSSGRPVQHDALSLILVALLFGLL